MKPSIRYLIGPPVSAFVLGVVLTGCAGIDTAPTPEAQQALAPTGKLRVGLYLGQPLSAIRDSASGEMKGVGYDLGRDLARQMGVPFEPVVYPSGGAVVRGAKSGEWDVAFLSGSAARGKAMDFTAPIVEIERSYLVQSGSSISTVADVDQPGIRVAVPAKGGTDRYLSRVLKNAVLVRGKGSAGAFELLKSGKADALAGSKPTLFNITDKSPGFRVLEGRFATDPGVMAMPKGRDPGLAYARKFIEDAKSKGLVKAGLEKAGARGAVVAPLQ